MYQGCIPKKTKNRRPIDEIAPKKQKMYLVPRYYMSVLMYQSYIPPPKKNRRPIDEITQKKQNKKQPKYRAQEMGVFSTVADNQLPNQLQQKSPTGSLPPAAPVAITPTFSPWTHTSDDSYIYQLSLVLATATVSYTSYIDGPPPLIF